MKTRSFGRHATPLVAGAVLALMAMSGWMVAAPALAGDSAGSTGLSQGERCKPFQVFDITGPNKGKQLCYV